MVHGSPLGLIDPQGRSGKKCAIKPMCPTLRAQIHGNPPGVVYGKIRIKQATKKGYIECLVGGLLTCPIPTAKPDVAAYKRAD